MEAQDKPTDDRPKPEQINVYSPEVEALATRAESLHLLATDPMTTQTQTRTRAEPPYLLINLITSHVMDIGPQDASNVRHALGSDHADPPKAPPVAPQWQFNIPR